MRVVTMVMVAILILRGRIDILRDIEVIALKVTIIKLPAEVRVAMATVMTPAFLLLGFLQIMGCHLRMGFMESMEQAVGSIQVQSV
jgi:hypothetical protein